MLVKNSLRQSTQYCALLTIVLIVVFSSPFSNFGCRTRAPIFHDIDLPCYVYINVNIQQNALLTTKAFTIKYTTPINYPTQPSPIILPDEFKRAPLLPPPK